jgi:anti-anti-sigma factor
MPIAIRIDTGDAAVVIAVDGELDISTAPELRDALSGLIDAGHRRVVLDLGGLAFCDSAGIGVFVRLAKRLTELDGVLALARPTPIVRTVLDVTGMVELVPITATLQDALAVARH